MLPLSAASTTFNVSRSSFFGCFLGMLVLFTFLADTTKAQRFTAEQLQSPSEFLGYELGTQWTPHYKVMDYVQHLA